MLNVSIHKYKLNIKHGTLYLDSLAFTSQEVHEFLSGVERVEYTAIVACCRDAVLLFHTSHLHAHMLGFYDYHHALRFEGLLYAVLDLLCEALLHLKTMAVDVYHAGYLAQSCDVSVGNGSMWCSHIEKKSMSLTMTIWSYFSAKSASVRTL